MAAAIRVLCVDDDVAFLDTTTAFIERDGFDVLAETSVCAALERLETEDIDCIVSDYQMPESDGLAFLARVRDSHPEIPFILFTGKGSEEIASEAISAGVTDYLRKEPTTEKYEVLTNRIENAVAKRRAERDLHRTESRYRRLAEQNVVGISIVQNDWFKYVNPKYAALFGYEPDELLCRSPLTVVAESDRDLVAESLAAREAGDEDEAHYTFTGRRKDGTTLDIEAHGGRIEYEGEPAVISVCKNVNDRRQREYTLRALHDATDDLVRAHTEEAVAERTVEAAETVLDFSIATVRLYDSDTGRLEPVASTDATTDVLGERPSYGRGEGLPWRAFSSTEPVLAGGTVTASDANDLPLESTMYLPIGEYGTLSIGAEYGEFTDSDIRLAQLLVANTETALERLEHEHQLARYEQLLDAAGDAIYLLDIDGTIRYGNAAAEALTGYDEAELLGEHISTVQNPDDTAQGRTIVEKLVAAAAADSPDESLTANEETAFENTVQTADGTEIPCESRLSLFEEDGDIEGVVGVARDITERKRRERMVETLHDAMRRMVRAMTQDEVAEITVETVERVLGMPVNGVWLYDEREEELRPAAVSERGRELFETPPTYAPGDSLSWAAFEQGETHTYDRIDREPNILNPDTCVKSEIIVPLGGYGVINIGSTEAAVFDDGDVSLANLLAANTEVALDRAERERLLRERETELERQNQRLEEFASVVSHDLRNPLGVARGRLELAREENPSEHHGDIEWALSRMNSLIEDLLALARQGEVVDEPTEVPLEEIAQSAWMGVEHDSATLNLDSPGTLDADAERLRRLIENLFRNAIEHGGPEVSVCVGRSSAGFFVADDGPGIPESERERVFESGYSTGDGTGLGLAIVRTIAEAHGWDVSVSVSDAGGVRFDIRI